MWPFHIVNSVEMQSADERSKQFLETHLTHLKSVSYGMKSKEKMSTS